MQLTKDNKILLQNIKALVLDVDGVLTDGKIILDNTDNELKEFNVKDGLGIKLLQNLGIKIAIITGKKSNILIRRMNSLGITEVYQAQGNKIKAFEQVYNNFQLPKSNYAYIGDDLPDLSIMKQVGISLCPNDANLYVRQNSNIILSENGGNGVVRELSDAIFQSHGLSKKLIQDFILLGQAGNYKKF